MRENNPGNAVDDCIEIRRGDQLALLLSDAEAKQRRLCFSMLSVGLRARRLLPLAPQERRYATRLRSRGKPSPCRWITPSASSLPM
jgi:hypothetical protein